MRTFVGPQLSQAFAQVAARPLAAAKPSVKKRAGKPAARQATDGTQAAEQEQPTPFAVKRLVVIVAGRQAAALATFGVRASRLVHSDSVRFSFVRLLVRAADDMQQAQHAGARRPYSPSVCLSFAIGSCSDEAESRRAYRILIWRMHFRTRLSFCVSTRTPVLLERRVLPETYARYVEKEA